MQIKLKTYEKLTKNELYALLQLRAEVFVVEQNCPYQDVDGKDDKALHVLAYNNKNLVGYTRCFPPKTYFEEASIGRVVVKKTHRGQGFARQLMTYSISVVKEHFKTSVVRISAQTYLIDFYAFLGFKTVGEIYLEDGLPHINMLLKS